MGKICKNVPDKYNCESNYEAYAEMKKLCMDAVQMFLSKIDISIKEKRKIMKQLYK